MGLGGGQERESRQKQVFLIKVAETSLEGWQSQAGDWAEQGAPSSRESQMNREGSVSSGEL